MDIDKRLSKLKKKMKEDGISFYYIPTSDHHSSEYVSACFKVREYFSGFTGSAGELLVTKDDAYLWTDGRYFIQAENELKDTGIKLMRSGEDGVPEIATFLTQNMSDKDVLGFDGRCVSYELAKKLKKAVPSGKIRWKKDLSLGIFERPAMDRLMIDVIGEDLAGESSIERISKLRDVLADEGCDGVFITDLCSIAYLYNIRAWDAPYTPVTHAFTYITREKAFIFLPGGKGDTGYPGAIIKDYDEVCEFLKSDAVKGRVMTDMTRTGYAYVKIIRERAKTVNRKDPTLMMRAVKNECEIRYIKDIYHRDSLQLTRFIQWMDKSWMQGTEFDAAVRLLQYRMKIVGFKGPSFETISAYADNAAIVHYAPDKVSAKAIERKGMLLVDSGGQYLGGTTDVTRTLVMGELGDDEKKAFTRVACAMLRILYSVFIKGASGANIDMLAREKLWKEGIDYKHGTGHGVGYMLSVHEGPQSIRWRQGTDGSPLEPGMLVSDEPGIYVKGKYGVRTENILLVEEDRRSEEGLFYRFCNLTQVPIDNRGMDRSIMSDEEISMYERYQREVVDALSPDMTNDEVKWLREYTGLSSDQ